MDLSKFKTSQWLLVGGGAAVLIFTFLDWWGTDAGGWNGFDYFFTGVVPWILIVGSAVLTFLIAAAMIKPGSIPWSMIFVAACALGFLLILIRLIAGPGHDVPDMYEDAFSRKIGLWISLIGAAVATAGAFMNFQEGGGKIDDFKNLANKAGNNSGSVPPPPGGYQTPPPPPPHGGSTPPPPPPGR